MHHTYLIIHKARVPVSQFYGESERGIRDTSECADKYYGKHHDLHFIERNTYDSLPVTPHMGATSQKRPWLAALLSILVTGLGHIYLRQWLRALWWVALVLVAGMFFLPDGVFFETQPSVSEIGPVFVIVALCVLDSYLLARVHNRRIAVSNLERCRVCGKELDPDLTFCWGCANTVEMEPPADTEAAYD